MKLGSAGLKERTVCAGGSCTRGAKAQGAQAMEDLRMAWSTCPGGRHPRAKRSHVSRLELSFKRRNWEGKGKQSFELWVSPEPSSEQWPQYLHLLPIYWDCRTLCKGLPCGKIHHPFHANTIKRTKQNSTNQVVCGLLVLPLFWMMLKTR